MEYRKISDIATFRNENIKNNKNRDFLYITTTHLLPDKAGISREYESSMGKSGKLFYKNDILVSNIRPYFKKIWKADRAGITSNDVLIFKSNELVSQEYLYYLLSQDVFFDMMTLTSKGTKMPRGDKDAISSYKVLVPNKTNQKKVTDILNALDKKIETNNKIIANLEAQAQAIFKYYFIDFEPFADGKFIDSDLGSVPEGWKVGGIQELGINVSDHVANGSFKSLKENVTILENKSYSIFLRNMDLKNDVLQPQRWVNKESYDFLKKTQLKGGEVVISNVGDVGSVYLVPKLNEPMVLGNNLIYLDVGDEIYNVYIYELFRSRLGKSMIKSITSGSVQQKFNKTDFRRLKIVIPDKKYLNKLYFINETIFTFKKQNQTLSQTRDALLPKLMAGEIDLENIGGAYD